MLRQVAKDIFSHCTFVATLARCKDAGQRYVDMTMQSSNIFCELLYFMGFSKDRVNFIHETWKYPVYLEI